MPVDLRSSSQWP